MLRQCQSLVGRGKAQNLILHGNGNAALAMKTRELILIETNFSTVLAQGLCMGSSNPVPYVLPF